MTLYTYIYTVGAAQGLVLAIALIIKTANIRSNRLLAVWMLCLVFDLTIKVIYLNDPHSPLLPAYVLASFFPFLYGSFYFLYVRTITTAKMLSWRDGVHFFGFIFMLVANFGWIVNPAQNRPRTFGYYELSLYLYSVSYVITGVLLLRKYRKNLDQQQSNTDGVNLLWLDVMAYFQVLIWLIAVTQWLIPIKAYNHWVIYVAVAAWMTVMGYLALLQQNIKPVKKIKKSGAVDDHRFAAVDAKLNNLMRVQQIYLDPELNMSQLAKKSGYPEYLVSLVINQKYQQSFREYINALRIEAAKTMLKDATNQHSVIDIAYDCGFTSKSTFNSAFKRLTEQTPTQFRQQALD
ncbi:helix-turn-helix domain-containing protein [Marinicella sp. S1101]|uniref:helix-turn-helix domain-containing protein n=1 Tax=Marinicella marina TaxID=2996016 RepID=UPI002260BD52|nr:helix-turn-helix domain-containing protein [Marinicella marina]MCX7552911.1 helix-turn-helix domain-containing protein [Marinicella marina]MDJ1139780.1 helix-turn-helix domain-containing protein [Marinicella marina]